MIISHFRPPIILFYSLEKIIPFSSGHAVCLTQTKKQKMLGSPGLHCLATLLQYPVHYNPDTLIDNIIDIQSLPFFVPVPQPMTHGNEKKADNIHVYLFFQVWNLLQFMSQQPKNGLFSSKKFFLILSG
jgi:hypothetical protein